MGKLSDWRDSASNWVSNPQDAFSNAWSDVEGGLVNSHSFSGLSGLYDWVPNPMGKEPNVNPADFQVDPGTREVGQTLVPGADNPVVAKMRDRTHGFLSNLNPAARAAAAQRTANSGFLKLAPLATQYWDRLFSLAKNLETTRDSIDTTSGDAAFLRGFFGGGGGGGLGALGGMSIGGGNRNSTSSGNPFANTEFTNLSTIDWNM